MDGFVACILKKEAAFVLLILWYTQFPDANNDTLLIRMENSNELYQISKILKFVCKQTPFNYF